MNFNAGNKDIDYDDDDLCRKKQKLNKGKRCRENIEKKAENFFKSFKQILVLSSTEKVP